MAVSRIVFWEPSVSPHKSAFFDALSRAAPHIEIVCCADKEISRGRRELGWSVKETPAHRTVVMPSRMDINKLVCTEPDSTLHVFSGIRWVPTILRGIEAVRRAGTRFAIMSEPRVREGWKGEVRFLQSWLTEGWFRKNGEFVLAIGLNGLPWFRSVGYSENKVFPFAYFVNPPTLNDYKDSLQESDESTIRVGYVGRLVEMKGIFDLVDAVCQLGVRVKLDIAGAGPEEARMKEACAAAKINACFHGVIPIQDVGRFMRNLDVLILASKSKDGWGVVISEALMCGTAVISTPFVGASIVLSNPLFGESVPAGAPDSICSAIQRQRSIGAFSPETRKQRMDSAALLLSANAGASYFLDILRWNEGRGARPLHFNNR